MRQEAHRQYRHRLEWTVVGVLAAAALVLGYVGFADVYPNEGSTQLLYRSLQLFVLESGAVPEGSAVPLSLEIARVLAPALTVYAAIRTLFLLFREQLEFLGSRFLLRDHAVIAGLGAKGFTLAKALRESGVRVVVLERDEVNPAIPGCRRRGIRVLAGDAADPALLDKARVTSARWLVVVAGANRANVEIAFTARALADARGGAPTVWIHLDDLVLWRLLQAEVLATARSSRVRLELFNVHEAAARMLLEELPAPAGADGERTAHVLVLGAGELGESLILHAARLPRSDDRTRKLRVTLACRDAVRERDLLAARYPALGESIALEAWEIDHLGAPPAATAVFVCLGDEDAGLIAALALHNRPELLGAPIVLAVDDDSSGVAIALRSSGALRDVVPFGVLSRTLTPELLRRGTNELLAQAKHAHYLECERARAVAAGTNESHVPWHQLPESLRESNRLFADSVGQKLEAAGLALLPAPLPDRDAQAFAFSDDEVEELARAEHDRWERDLGAQGWRFGPVKDPERKLHPSLVPWSELGEDERDKDREPVRALPEMLARMGFAIVRSEDAHALESWAASKRP